MTPRLGLQPRAAPEVAHLLRFAFGDNDQVQVNEVPMGVFWAGRQIASIPVTLASREALGLDLSRLPSDCREQHHAHHVLDSGRRGVSFSR